MGGWTKILKAAVLQEIMSENLLVMYASTLLFTDIATHFTVMCNYATTANQMYLSTMQYELIVNVESTSNHISSKMNSW